MGAERTGHIRGLAALMTPPYSRFMSLKQWLNESPGAKLDEADAARRTEIETRVATLQELRSPFDPRNEVSADAEYVSGRIVKHLWIIFVLLPVVLGILFAILRNS